MLNSFNLPFSNKQKNESQENEENVQIKKEPSNSRSNNTSPKIKRKEIKTPGDSDLQTETETETKDLSISQQSSLSSEQFRQDFDEWSFIQRLVILLSFLSGLGFACILSTFGFLPPNSTLQSKLVKSSPPVVSSSLSVMKKPFQTLSKPKLLKPKVPSKTKVNKLSKQEKEQIVKEFERFQKFLPICLQLMHTREIKQILSTFSETIVDSVIENKKFQQLQNQPRSKWKLKTTMGVDIKPLNGPHVIGVLESLRRQRRAIRFSIPREFHEHVATANPAQTTTNPHAHPSVQIPSRQVSFLAALFQSLRLYLEISVGKSL